MKYKKCQYHIGTLLWNELPGTLLWNTQFAENVSQFKNMVGKIYLRYMKN